MKPIATRIESLKKGWGSDLDTVLYGLSYDFVTAFQQVFPDPSQAPKDIRRWYEKHNEDWKPLEKELAARRERGPEDPPKSWRKRLQGLEQLKKKSGLVTWEEYEFLLLQQQLQKNSQNHGRSSIPATRP